LTNRATAGPTDESNALAQAANWHSRADTGQSEAVLRECVAALMSQPRSWFALQAQLVMDDLMTNYDSFRSLNVSNLAPGDFAYDLFFYSAVGVAATYNDWQRYWGNLKPLTGITDTSGDRSGDMLTVLSRFGYPAPLIQISPGPAPDQATVWLQKDAPGLAYSLQSQTGLHPDYWQDIFPPAFDTNTLWSTMVDLDRGSGSVFYRVGTTFDFYITPSPPWPNGFNGL
jgi:hypothetical protein